MSLRYIDVLPSNISTTANAGYSQGSPLVQFVIGAQDAFLLGSTIRLNGHYEIDGSNSANAQWEPSLGIYNVLEQLIIASNKTNQTIEHIRNYNRFLSSYTKVTSSEADLLGHMNMTSLTTTTETQCLKFDGTAFDFSIPLPCGLFLGRNPIPLAAQWGTKGLNITLHLAPDSNVFFSTSGYTANNSVYKLKNLHLTAEVQVPPPDQLSKLMNQTANSFEYNSISSYYAVINNSYATINLNLGLRRVLAVFANFVTSSHINNYTQNGMATYDIRQLSDSNEAVVTEVIFTKGGVRFPLQYDIASVQRDDPSVTSGDGQLLRNFVNAIKPFASLERTTIDSTNSHRINKIRATKKGPQPVFGVGIAYDTISNQGIDFSSEPFSMIIKSGLTTDNPTSAFVFAHSKESLLMSGDGIQVLS
jgi:hypothetical protein